MNVGQIARNQRMMYDFINRGANSGYTAQIQSQFSSVAGLDTSSKNNGAGTADLLQSMGISGLQGRTAREMAQYQMRVQGTQSAAQQTAAGLDAPSRTERFSVRQQYAPISDEATEAMQ